ncbi:MAG TPA: choice-of-anchor R domain-containing protein [Verrucomicrobiae bacterium]|nr:choice-of-anchor R domain-containing protein [Verrucomicrobiae bacterium]
MEPSTTSAASGQSVDENTDTFTVPVHVGTAPGSKPVVEGSAIDSDFVALNPSHIAGSNQGPITFAGPGAATTGSFGGPDESSTGAVSNPQSTIATSVPTSSATHVLDTPFNSSLQPPGHVGGDDPVNQGSLLDQVPLTMPQEELPEPPQRISLQRLIGLGLLLLGIVAALILGVRLELTKNRAQNTPVSASQRVRVQTTSLPGVSSQLTSQSSASPQGVLTVNGSLVLTPTIQPSNPMPGQFYYDQASHKVQYYDGTGFVPLQGGNVVTNNTYNNSTVTNTYANSTVSNVYNATTNSTYVTNGANISGTPGTIALFAGNGDVLGDSLLTEVGGTLNVGQATGTNTTNLFAGSGGISIATASAANDTGSVTISSGTSTAAQAGDVTIDTGNGLVNGTIIEDYTFEDGTDGFGFYTGSSGSCVQSSDYAHTGIYSLELLNGISGPSCVSGNVPIVGGHTYFISVWAREAAGSSPGIANEGVYWTNGSGGPGPSSSSCQSVTTTTTNWTQLTCVAKAPAGKTYALPSVGLNWSGTEYFDDFTITDMSNLTGSSVNIGTTNAQGIVIGNSNEVGLTSVNGGQSGVTINSGSGGLTVNATSYNIIGSSASSIGTTSGPLIITSGGGTSGNGVIVQPQNDATDAFSVENASGDTKLLNVDTADSEISLGTGAGASFGETAGGTNDGCCNEGYMIADQFTTTAGGAVESLTTFAALGGITAAPANEFQMGIYTDNSGAPGSYVASTAVSTLTTAGAWYTVPVTATLAANTSYWLVYWTNVSGYGSNNAESNVASPGGKTYSGAETWQAGSDNGMPATFPSGSGGTGYHDSIYATYSSSGPALTINSAGLLTQNGPALFQDPTDSTQALQVQDSLGNTVFNVNTADDSVGLGSTLIKPQTDSTSVFSVQNANGSTTLFNVDSTDDVISLGTGAGSSFGYAGTTNTSSSALSSGELYAWKYTTTAAGTLTSLSAYVSISQAVAPNNKYQMAIYADNGGSPGAYLASTAVGTLSTVWGAWNTLSLTTPLNVTATTTYWLVFWQNGSNNALGRLSGSSTVVEDSVSSTWQGGTSNGMPATFPAGSVGNSIPTGIYATFTGSGPALTINQYGTLTQQGAAIFQDPTDSTQALQVQNSLGGVLLTADTADMEIIVGGNLSVSGDITVDGHIITGGGAPPIAAGAAACTGPTVSVTGDDTAGTIIVTTGTGCSGAGAMATVTFANAFANVPHVTLTPGTASTAALQSYVDVPTLSTSSFSLKVGVAPANSTTYYWEYWVAQ